MTLPASPGLFFPNQVTNSQPHHSQDDYQHQKQHANNYEQAHEFDQVVHPVLSLGWEDNVQLEVTHEFDLVVHLALSLGWEHNVLLEVNHRALKCLPI